MKTRPIILTMAAAIAITACSANTGSSFTPCQRRADDGPIDGAQHGPQRRDVDGAHPWRRARQPAAVVTDSPAADLRTTLDLKLGEHIILASRRPSAALGGRNDEFAAYGGLLNTNGTDLGAMIGTVYGQEAEDAFNSIWSAHNGFFVDYTTGVATDDQAMQDKAVEDLTTIYVPAVLALHRRRDRPARWTPSPASSPTTCSRPRPSSTPRPPGTGTRPTTAIRDRLRPHADDRRRARAGAIVGPAPGQSPATPTNAGVDFRVALNQLLQEHLYLATLRDRRRARRPRPTSSPPPAPR